MLVALIAWRKSSTSSSLQVSVYAIPDHAQLTFQRLPSELQESFCSLLPGSGRSSVLVALIAWKKSSTPSSLQVSAYALSDRHLGQVRN